MPTRYSPFESLWTFNQMFNNLFNQAFVRPYFDSGFSSSQSYYPTTDVVETPDSLIFHLTVPGYQPDWINITVTGNTLTVEGNVPEAAQPENVNYLLHERVYGPFHRVWTLPIEVEADKAEAQFENGVLTLTLPKAEAVRPKQIKISAGAQKMLTS